MQLLKYLNSTFNLYIFVDKYFKSFYLVTHRGVNRNRLRVYSITGRNNCQKRKADNSNRTHQTKKQCNFNRGRLEQQQVT